MTDNEINAAIAEACWWTELEIYTAGHPQDDVLVGFAPDGHKCKTPVPDYANDLNAMHEAEKTLTKEEFGDYYRRLRRIATPPAGCIHTSAPRRAEAFLRTKGLWKE